MSNAESNLQERLAEILNHGKDDPFSKLASIDAQLDEVVEATIEPTNEVIEEVEAAVEEPVQKEASVTDFAVRELFAQSAFRQGFTDTLNERSDEITAAIEKVAARGFNSDSAAGRAVTKSMQTGAGLGATAGGGAGAVSGYRNARAAGKGRISSAVSGAVHGAGGAVLGGALGGAAGGIGRRQSILNRAGKGLLGAKKPN